MPFIVLKIPHKCPYCQKINSSLKHYRLVVDIPYKFVGDFIINYSSKKLDFIKGINHCSFCEHDYQCRIGIKESILTNIAVCEKETE